MKIKERNKWLTGALMAGMLTAVCVSPVMASESTTVELKNLVASESESALAAPENVGWSEKNVTKATWDKVEGADAYLLHLFFNEEHINTIRAKRSAIDLAEYMTEEGWYDYMVCALVETESGNKYRIGSDYAVSEELELRDLGYIDGTWKNYVEGKKYQKEDASFAAAEWCKILGKWYYFDENGYMVTGWKLLGGTWYYMDQEGVMQTGWITDGGLSYYLKESGAMQTGWMQTGPGVWYYFYESGAMAVNTVIDGYAINERGLWIQE